MKLIVGTVSFSQRLLTPGRNVTVPFLMTAKCLKDKCLDEQFSFARSGGGCKGSSFHDFYSERGAGCFLFVMGA